MNPCKPIDQKLRPISMEVGHQRDVGLGVYIFARSFWIDLVVPLKKKDGILVGRTRTFAK